MSRLNQVVAIAAQISADVANPHNHKYLSHQLALLHVRTISLIHVLHTFIIYL